jgi:hypothetical protein
MFGRIGCHKKEGDSVAYGQKAHEPFHQQSNKMQKMKAQLYRHMHSEAGTHSLLRMIADVIGESFVGPGRQELGIGPCFFLKVNIDTVIPGSLLDFRNVLLAMRKRQSKRRGRRKKKKKKSMKQIRQEMRLKVQSRF